MKVGISFFFSFLINFKGEKKTEGAATGMTVYGCCNVSDDGFQERSTVNIIIKGFKKNKSKVLFQFLLHTN